MLVVAVIREDVIAIVVQEQNAVIRIFAVAAALDLRVDAAAVVVAIVKVGE